METQKDKLNWYVLRCQHGKERLYRDQLVERFGITTFLPIKKERRRDPHGRFVWVSVCALTSYIFVKSTKETLLEMTREERRFRAMCHQVEGVWIPLIVPDNQMESFIRVAGSGDEKVTYLDPSLQNFCKGDKVRVIGGPFAGVEGVFVQIGGKHEKRVVIQLENIVTVATCAIPASLVEKI